MAVVDPMASSKPIQTNPIQSTLIQVRVLADDPPSITQVQYVPIPLGTAPRARVSYSILARAQAVLNRPSRSSRLTTILISTSSSMRPDYAGPERGPEAPFPIELRGPVIKGFGRGSKEVGTSRHCCRCVFGGRGVVVLARGGELHDREGQTVTYVALVLYCSVVGGRGNRREGFMWCDERGPVELRPCCELIQLWYGVDGG